ncbi:hypothetical protein BXY85_3746 [Roseivirga pacifica]|uniref:Uncharacterized protein n=1 Tax=Roseivirga pacifica TaxID=1267423 RepID=A0A1I0Q9T0_9BACT|nr:hypothetical protein BXY85_3746 [Roseivirga pacifica]SEW23548.1 hypothetical protein SAMN05216290_2129 [Roseivirga pacifica]
MEGLNITVNDHMRLFPTISKATAYREWNRMLDDLNLKNRKKVTPAEYCEYWQIDISQISHLSQFSQ